MNAKQLRDAIACVPDDVLVEICWDGGPRGDVASLWISRRGSLVLGDDDCVVYNTDDRPPSAPTEKEDRFWMAPVGCTDIPDAPVNF